MSRPKQAERRELWYQRVTQQKNSGQTVRAFCREHKLSEYSFYAWRRQLGSSSEMPVRFALVETTATSGVHRPSQAPLELFLPGGERLQLLSELGIVGFLLLAAWMVPILVLSFRSSSAERDPQFLSSG